MITIPTKVLLSDMEIVQRFVSLGEKIRLKRKIGLKYPLLDFAYGGYYFFDKDFVRLMAQCFNIYNQGYDFTDKNFYGGSDCTPPGGEEWETMHDGKLWLSLNFNVPDWLMAIGDKRMAERKLIMNNKNENKHRLYYESFYESNSKFICEKGEDFYIKS